MGSFRESRGILWLSAALVAATHGLVLFAWTPAPNSPGVLLDTESTGVEVDLVASGDPSPEVMAPPVEEPPSPEPEEQAPPESIPPHEETPPVHEVFPEAEAPPTPTPTPASPRPGPKPKKSSTARAEKPNASTNTDGAPGSGSPNVSASQAAFAKRPTLIYPAESRHAREEGTVMLRITVDARGRPTHVAIIKGSGFPRLDRAAIEGAWRCRIQNAIAGMILDVPLRFDLDE